MAEHEYDLFVIGGGSGGVRAGRMAASLGKKVGIAEEHRYGGTCVIRGCVPKKLMVYASRFSGEFEAAHGFGWTLGKTRFDWQVLIENKDREIDRLEGLYRKGLLNAGAQVLDTRAELAGPDTIYLVNQNKTVTAKKILIATGGTPGGLPSLPGRELCISSDDVFYLDALPEKIVINGGGYVALEFAAIFAGLGSQVSVVYRGEEILRGFDDDLRINLHKEMIAKGIKVLCGRQFVKVEAKSENSKSVTLDDGRVLEADQVMLAVGRIPTTSSLGLEKVGVETDDNGFIKVNAFSKSTAPSIWAVGDVTNRVALTPVAIHEAMCFIDTEYRDNPVSPDHELIATAVFTQPEIGTIGKSEAEAAREHNSIEIYRAHFRPMKNTLSGSGEKMLIKIIVEAGSGIVLGVHLLGDDAGELAQVLGIALKAGATKADFDRTMAVHPTAAEELVTMYLPSYRLENGKRVDA